MKNDVIQRKWHVSTQKCKYNTSNKGGNTNTKKDVTFLAHPAVDWTVDLWYSGQNKGMVTWGVNMLHACFTDKILKSLGSSQTAAHPAVSPGPAWNVPIHALSAALWVKKCGCSRKFQFSNRHLLISNRGACVQNLNFAPKLHQNADFQPQILYYF